ncbi:60S ribosomal protein L6 [Camellia lanceoleosa]|uniref:60S ribosomal protein L6 n=1 Tax=Camellia lanceoleosa TaxID=1840588 RepID=A0ACC0IXL9_9ERIC|nr:60S ribosomal protein L6 [Camellia lanceoleosa]
MQNKLQNILVLHQSQRSLFFIDLEANQTRTQSLSLLAPILSLQIANPKSSLNQIRSILLFIPGPFKLNGVPLRHVNQSYLIDTLTKVDISGVNVEKFFFFFFLELDNVEKFDDKYFAKQVEKKKKKGEGEFFEAKKDICL